MKPYSLFAILIATLFIVACQKAIDVPVTSNETGLKTTAVADQATTGQCVVQRSYSANRSGYPIFEYFHRTDNAAGDITVRFKGFGTSETLRIVTGAIAGTIDRGRTFINAAGDTVAFFVPGDLEFMLYEPERLADGQLGIHAGYASTMMFVSPDERFFDMGVYGQGVMFERGLHGISKAAPYGNLSTTYFYYKGPSLFPVPAPAHNSKGLPLSLRPGNDAFFRAIQLEKIGYDGQ